MDSGLGTNLGSSWGPPRRSGQVGSAVFLPPLKHATGREKILASLVCISPFGSCARLRAGGPCPAQGESSGGEEGGEWTGASLADGEFHLPFLGFTEFS